jgi:hypothetical protein
MGASTDSMPLEDDSHLRVACPAIPDQICRRVILFTAIHMADFDVPATSTNSSESQSAIGDRFRFRFLAPSPS